MDLRDAQSTPTGSHPYRIADSVRNSGFVRSAPAMVSFESTSDIDGTFTVKPSALFGLSPLVTENELQLHDDVNFLTGLADSCNQHLLVIFPQAEVTEPGACEHLNASAKFHVHYSKDSRCTDTLFSHVNFLFSLHTMIKKLDRELNPTGSRRDFYGDPSYTPGTDEIERQFSLFQHSNPHLKAINRTSVDQFHIYLLNTLRWTVERETVNMILRKPLHRCSFGDIPLHGLSLTEENEFSESGNAEQEQPSRKVHLSREERIKAKIQRRLEIQRLNVRKDVDPANSGPFPGQNENPEVRIIFDEQPSYRSSIKLQLHFNFVDETKSRQPYAEATIILNEHNLRQATVSTSHDQGESHRQFRRSVYNERWATSHVTQKRHDDMLQMLFGHIDAGYFTKLRKETVALSEQTILLRLPFNGLNLSCGMHMTQPEYFQHPKIRALRRILRNPGYIQILVQGSQAIGAIPAMKKAITNQARRFVVLDFLRDPIQPYLSLQNLQDPALAPVFSARSDYIFPTDDEYRIVYGVSALYDYHASKSPQDYFGLMTCLPVSVTHNAHLGLHMVYEASVVLSSNSDDLPKLTKGDNVRITLGREGESSSEIWLGRIIENGTQPGLGHLALHIFRPHVSANATGYLTADLSSVADQEFQAMQGSTLLSTLQNLKPRHVTITPDEANDKEIKRVINGLSATTLSKSDSFELRGRKEAGVNLCRGVDDESLPRTSLWKTIAPDHARSLARWAYEDCDTRAISKQRRVLEDMQDDRLFAGLAAVVGPGGGGKTEVATIASAPYATEVVVSNESLEFRQGKRAQWLENERARISREEAEGQRFPKEILDRLDQVKPNISASGEKIIPGCVLSVALEIPLQMLHS